MSGMRHHFQYHKQNKNKLLLKNFGKYGEWMTIWLEQYIAKCKVSTHSYICWKRYCNSKRKKSSLNSIVSKNHSNIAHQCMYGFELFHKEKYTQSIKYLNTANSQWKHPLILCALANSLLQLNKYKSSLIILQSLMTENKWNFFVTYLDSCCIEPFLSDLLTTVHNMSHKCYTKMLHSKISLKRINKYIIYQNYCLQFQQNTDDIGNIIQILIQIIRLKYWSNSHLDGVKYIIKLQKISKQHEHFLNFHTVRISLALLSMEIWT
eukprot:325484_1